MYSALAISLIMHLAIMRVLPWLESARAKPPIAIIAEFMQPPPPPAEAPTESKPDEPITKPEVVKVEQPKPKPQAVPVLASRHADSIDNHYTVPDAPQPAVAPSEPSAPAVEESASATPTTTSASNNATSTPSTSTWDDSDVWDEYGSNLQKLCERYKKYPEIARRRGWQGAGNVVVRFSAEGKTISIAIEQSTGQESLDNQALEMVRKSLADLPLPPKFKGKAFKLTIPVDFKLE
jgi:protein TonB